MRRAFVVGSVVGGVALLACLGPTQITLRVTSDLPCARIKDTAIHAGATQLDAPIAASKDCTSVVGGAEVGTLVLTPSGDKDEAFTIAVVMGVDVATESCASVDYRGCIVARRRARYVPHEALEMPIEMSEACLGLVCDPAQTCFRGACISADVKTGVSGCLGPDCAPGTVPPVGDATVDVRPDALVDAGRDSENPADSAATESLSILFATPGKPLGLYLTSTALVWSERLDGPTPQTLVRVWPLGASASVPPPALCQRTYVGAGIHVADDGSYAGVARASGACEDICMLVDAGLPPTPPICDAGAFGVAHVPGSTVYVGTTMTQRNDVVVATDAGGAFAETAGTSVFFAQATRVAELAANDKLKTYDITADGSAAGFFGLAVTTNHFFVATNKGELFVVRRSSVGAVVAVPLLKGRFQEVSDLAYHEPTGTLYIAGTPVNEAQGIYRYVGFQARLP